MLACATPAGITEARFSIDALKWKLRKMRADRHFELECEYIRAAKTVTL
jgi:hypothetical protein